MYSIVKANTDYASEEFPSVAHICDFVRCSVAAPNCDVLFKAIEKFIEAIGKGKAGCVVHLVRLKNGFSYADEWDTTPNTKKTKISIPDHESKETNDIDDDDEISGELENYEYFDIKLNVVIEDRLAESMNANKGKGIKMIAEIQFLLSDLLNAKKIGHKVYAIQRKKGYFAAVCDNTDVGVGKTENFRAFRKKLGKLIDEKKYKEFAHELLLKPNMVVALGDDAAWAQRISTYPKFQRMYDATREYWKKSFMKREGEYEPLG